MNKLFISRQISQIKEEGIEAKWRKLKTISRRLIIFFKIKFKSKKQSDVLYAFYDLAVSPATFDIIQFLILAEQARILSNLGSLHIVVVPGPNEGFRMNDLQTYNEQGATGYTVHHLEWRKNNILIPCCNLLQSIGGVSTCNSREEVHAIESSIVKHIFPKGYTVRSPIQSYYLNLIVNNKGDLPTIKSGNEPRKIINNWIKLNADGKKIITITLRESKYQKHRNSNLMAWSNFARGLDNNYFIPVFIRDTDTVFELSPVELKGLTIFNEVCFNLELRAALYELSYINMFVSNGPAFFCRYLRNSCTLTFKLVNEDMGMNYFTMHGVEYGDQLPPHSVFHKLVWEKDNYETINKEFEKMCTVISQT